MVEPRRKDTYATSRSRRRIHSPTKSGAFCVVGKTWKKGKQVLKMGKPMYNFGKTANLKVQQQKQMDRDLKRRAAKQSRANIKSSKPNKEAAIAEPSRVADIVEGAA